MTALMEGWLLHAVALLMGRRFTVYITIFEESREMELVVANGVAGEIWNENIQTEILVCSQ